MVEKTSPEFNDGKVYRLTKSQLYWWETEREMHMGLHKLNQFYSNYPSTPEESFQHSLAGALPYAVLERIRLEAPTWGMPYDLEYKELVKI